jgi:glycosyltransferase involved in cell wall biosynthesis
MRDIKMNNNVLILTSKFPFAPGEEFIETELPYWELFLRNNIKVTVCPAGIDDKIRSMPKNINLSLILAKSIRNRNIYKFIYALRALFSFLFWKEIIKKKCGFSLKNVYIALGTSASVIKYSDILRSAYKKKPNLVYSYWFDVLAYAAVVAFKNNSKIITRAHGFDVYADRRSNYYMPLKWQFKDDIDYIFAISDEGKEYLHKTYNILKEKIKISRLGVLASDSFNVGEMNKNVLNIISISYCVPVKRIDKIIDALFLVCINHPNILINWCHYGDGVLRKNLEIYADKKFKQISNIKYNFSGYVSNSELLKIIDSSAIDVLINASESEGVPVSIMEVMSRGIPVIAPAVGGIPEQIINKENGILLTNNPLPQEIADAIFNNISFFKSINTRLSCMKRYENMYSANSNYRDFVYFLIKEINIKG